MNEHTLGFIFTDKPAVDADQAVKIHLAEVEDWNSSNYVEGEIYKSFIGMNFQSLYMLYSYLPHGFMDNRLIRSIHE